MSRPDATPALALVHLRPCKVSQRRSWDEASRNPHRLLGCVSAFHAAAHDEFYLNSPLNPYFALSLCGYTIYIVDNHCRREYAEYGFASK